MAHNSLKYIKSKRKFRYVEGIKIIQRWCTPTIYRFYLDRDRELDSMTLRTITFQVTMVTIIKIICHRLLRFLVPGNIWHWYSDSSGSYCFQLPYAQCGRALQLHQWYLHCTNRWHLWIHLPLSGWQWCWNGAHLVVDGDDVSFFRTK